MSYTLQVKDGHIVLDSASGLLSTVSGNRKCSQDLGEVLLQEYFTEQGYGSFLKKIIQNKIPFASEFFVRHYAADAVNTLISFQTADVTTTPEEQINQIEELITVDDNEGTVGFFINASTKAGPSVSTGVIQATSFNHLFEGFT